MGSWETRVNSSEGRRQLTPRDAISSGRSGPLHGSERENGLQVPETVSVEVKNSRRSTRRPDPEGLLNA